MTADHRTYRVPKRVVRKVQAAILGGVEGADLAAVRTAEALMGDKPVDVEVPRAVVAFFSRDWRSHPGKAGIAGLYGGTTGLEWARKCSGDPEPVVAAAVDGADDEYGDLAGYGHSDADGLLRYGKRASVEHQISEEDEEEALFAALLAELEGITPGAEILAVQEPVQESPPGAEVLAEDEDAGEDDEVRQMTVAAMRDAVSAASATLAAESATAEGAAPAGDAAGPKALPRDPRAPLW